MKKAKPIMIQGTMSNAGKSLICTALCRILAQDGYKVAPFKSQNMALNSFITRDGLEMGRAQVVQAEAAGAEPDVCMNPILLKPTTDVGSQVIVNGIVRGNMKASEYFEYKKHLVSDILTAYHKLEQENDIIVIEGAGSPAEINLKKDDIVNMGLAKMVDAPVILVGDIDRGGVFAQLYGTVELLEEDERKRIKALIVNKFRGDISVLGDGILRLEELTGIKCAGVVPYAYVDIDDEDSLSGRLNNRIRKEIDIAVIRLPRISNFTDFAVLEQFDAVSVRYISNTGELQNPDLIIIPGTKSTISDMLWMRANGLEAAVKKYAAAGGLILGICGGLQILGSNISDREQSEWTDAETDVSECMKPGRTVTGMQLLPVNTEFAASKTQNQTQGKISGLTGVYSELNGLQYSGYEIHMGISRFSGAGKNCLNKAEGRISDCECGAFIQNNNILASYVHGLLDDGLGEALVGLLYSRKGITCSKSKPFDYRAYKQTQYDELASIVRHALDMEQIYTIIGC